MSTRLGQFRLMGSIVKQTQIEAAGVKTGSLCSTNGQDNSICWNVMVYIVHGYDLMGVGMEWIKSSKPK